MREKCTAVVLAAGSGRRMQSHVAKQYLLLHGKPVLWYALQVFEESKIIDEVILVVGKGEIPYCQQEIVERYGFRKVVHVIEGGAERYLSVWEALKGIDEQGILFIHDGARPFVSEKILEDTYEAVLEHGACVTGIPVKDTIKIARNRVIQNTPDRSTLFAVQTPQTFAVELLRAGIAHARANDIALTDDCSAVESIGVPVILTEGSYENIKLTTPEDLWFAQALLKRRQGV